ncbi:MAG: SpoIIE family protein phosphatase [Capsulimonadaceae bacterium]
MLQFREIERLSPDWRDEADAALGLEGCLAFDRDGRCVHANLRAERLLGATRESLVGTAVDAILDGDAGARLLGAFQEACQGRSAAYDEHFERLGLWLAVRAAPAPEGARVLFHDVTPQRESARQAERIATLALALLPACGLSEALDAIARVALPAMGASCAAVIEGVGCAPIYLGPSENWPDGALAQVEKAARSDIPIFIEGNAGGRAGVMFCALPMRRGDGAVGGMGLWLTPPQPAGQYERVFMIAAAAQCGAAIERGRLHDGERRVLAAARRELQELAAAERALRESERRYRRLLETSSDGIVTVDRHDIITYANPRIEQMLDEEPGALVGRNLSDILYDDAPSHRRGRLRARQQRELRLRRACGEGLWAVASANTVTERGGFSGSLIIFTDIDVRKRTEAQLAAAYAAERRIADALQRTLLTRPPDSAIPGLEIETLYRPAHNDALVGGDYYDVIAIEGGRVALVVGDVSGKGLEAASRTAELKYTLRAYLRDFSDPGSALTRLNSFLIDARELEGDDEREYFVCLTLAVLDPSTGAGTVHVAGSEPPLVVRAGTVTPSECWGMPLGIQIPYSFTPGQIQLDPGDLLIISTDGVTEARHGRDFFGHEGITASVLTRGAQTPLRELGDGILNDARAHSGGSLSDDACLLIARRRECLP